MVIFLEERIMLSDRFFGGFGIANMFDDVFGTAYSKREDDKYVVRVPVPGLKKGQVKIRVDNDVLIVSAVRGEEKDWSIFVPEDFEHRFSIRHIASKIDMTNISAVLEDGVLTVCLPCKEGLKRDIVVA
jgi:HSP20 family protein